MKFHQLKTGESFTYQGEVYRKVSPLIAHHQKDGQQKMFRRADSVQIAHAVEQSEKDFNNQGESATQKVEIYLEQLHQCCEQILERYLSDVKPRRQAVNQLNTEYSRIIKSLE